MKKIRSFLILSLILALVLQANALSASAATVLKTPQIKDIVQTGDNEVGFDWDKITNSDGYNVQYRQGKSEWKNYNTTKLYATIKKLKIDKTYSFRVRAYKKSGNKKIFSSFSKIKTIKVAALMKPLSASTTRSLTYSNRTAYVNATTAKKGWWWWSPVPTTTYTFRNNNSYGSGVAVYQYTYSTMWGWVGPVYKFEVYGGQTRSLSIKQSGLSVKFFLQKTGGSNASITVTASGGSIW